MTFRDVARRYLGWCPGFNRVLSYQMGDVRPNFKLLTLTTATFLVAIIVISILNVSTLPISLGEPLQVYLPFGEKRGVYLDKDFNQTFDYSYFLTDKGGAGLFFFESVNMQEFANGSKPVITTFWVSTVDDVMECTSTLDMPNSMRECVRWLISQDFNATYVKVFGEPRRDRLGDIGRRFGEYLPSSRIGLTEYSLDRVALYGGYSNNEDYDGQLVITDGVSLLKSSDKAWEYIWYLGIDGCAESQFQLEPRYRVRIVHYPMGNSNGSIPGG
jgi:hypothetical protein